jgi:hypothetical protein
MKIQNVCRYPDQYNSFFHLNEASHKPLNHFHHNKNNARFHSANAREGINNKDKNNNAKTAFFIGLLL